MMRLFLIVCFTVGICVANPTINTEGGNLHLKGDQIMFSTTSEESVVLTPSQYLTKGDYETIRSSAVGPTGPQGMKGEQGVTGAMGPTGPTGTKGEKGMTGATGTTGTTGAPGTTGATGAKGMKGDSGAMGPTGPVGPTGTAGIKGDTGMIGSTGPTGPQGAVGPTGANGVNGMNGAAGSNGAKGQKGELGSTGTSGMKGQKGDTGANGSNGTPGTNCQCTQLGTNTNPAVSCLEILKSGGSTGSGFYTLKYADGATYTAYCDMTSNGGGWTMFGRIKATNGNGNLLVSKNCYAEKVDTGTWSANANDYVWRFSYSAMQQSNKHLLIQEVPSPNREQMYDFSAIYDFVGAVTGDTHVNPLNYNWGDQTWEWGTDGPCNDNDHSQYNCEPSNGVRFHYGTRNCANNGGSSPSANMIDWFTGYVDGYANAKFVRNWNNVYDKTEHMLFYR